MNVGDVTEPLDGDPKITRRLVKVRADDEAPAAVAEAPPAFIDPQAGMRRQYRAAIAARDRAVQVLVAAGVDLDEAEDQIPFDYEPFIGLRCGAKGKRTGKPCPLTSIFANGRCRWHGGLSTGPKSAEGKARSAANARGGVMLSEPHEAGKVRPRSAGNELLAKPSIPLRPDAADAAGGHQGSCKGTVPETGPQGGPEGQALPEPQPRPVAVAGGPPGGGTVLSRIRAYLADRPGRRFTAERLAGALRLPSGAVAAGLRFLVTAGRIEAVVLTDSTVRYRALDGRR